MSNWDWYQSKYLFRRAAMAPYPQAMAGSFASGYEADITINGPYNYGVFTPKIPYGFPRGYSDPHLESGGGAYSGFGGLGGEFSLPTGQKIDLVCDPAGFIDRLMKRLPLDSLPWSLVKSPIQSGLNQAAATAFDKLIAAVGAGRDAFNTWFKINVSYNIEKVSNGLVSQDLINSTLLPMVWSPIQQTLEECKASVAPPATAPTPGATDPSSYPHNNSQVDGAACVAGTQCISTVCSGGKCVAPMPVLSDLHLIANKITAPIPQMQVKLDPALTKLAIDCQAAGGAVVSGKCVKPSKLSAPVIAGVALAAIALIKTFG